MNSSSMRYVIQWFMYSSPDMLYAFVQLLEAMQNVAWADTKGRELFNKGVEETDIAAIYGHVQAPILPGDKIS